MLACVSGKRFDITTDGGTIEENAGSGEFGHGWIISDGVVASATMCFLGRGLQKKAKTWLLKCTHNFIVNVPMAVGATLRSPPHITGFFLSLGIWSTAEGFGGPYILGHSTDIGTALPYAILFAILFCISAGRYYGLDQWLAPRLGRLSFLATGTFKQGDR